MRHNNKILFKLMLVGLAFASCNKYLDVNTDPNRVTDANITPELIFTQAEVAVGGRQASGDFLFFDHWMGYSAQNGGFAPQQNEITYNLDPNFSNPIFVNHYEVLFDLHQAAVKAQANGDIGVVAASMILSAKLWQELVDLYGNIPYAQAFQVNTTTTPGYTNAQDIYSALQLSLDTAITDLGQSTSSAFSKADVIAQGNTGLWIKFANTLKLRLLIRQSQVSGFDPSAEITKIISNGGPQGPGESISDNPGYVNDVSKQNPFYAGFGWSPTGVVSTGSDNANNYIVTILGANADPRLGQFFYPIAFNPANPFAGAVYGADVGSIPTQANLSYFGPGLVGTVSGGKGDGTGAVQNQWIMPSFEAMFFTAEATARGWYPGDPKTAYQAAVTESFLWLGLDTVAANTYLASPAGSWDLNAGGTPSTEATFVVYQKYLSMTMIDPLEAYSDLRRLNMLTDNSYISAAPGKISNTLPIRLLYPQVELTTNQANVQKQGTINAFTSKLFWEP